MATVSYFARVDNSNAANSNLNVRSDASTTLTFDSGLTGDLTLEQDPLGYDPDTMVSINGGTLTTFTVVLTGVLPASGKVPVPLQGKTVMLITVNSVPPINYFFVLDGSGTLTLMDGIGNGALSILNVVTNPPPTPVCFCAGTDILTPSGNRKVETLVAGDMVLTSGGDAKQVMWVGCSRYSAAELEASPNMRPIRIAADAIAPGVPASDLKVSPQHRVVLEGALPQLLFGEARVLVAGKHLVGTLAEVATDEADVEYYHVMLKGHEILVSNGLASESFQPAQRTLDTMTEANRAVLTETLKALGAEAMLTRKDALHSVKRHEAKALADALLGAGRGKADGAEHRLPQ